MNQVFKVKKAFLAPFILTVALLLVLLLISFFTGQLWEKILLAVLCIVTAIIAIEAFEREFAVSEDGLRIRKFFRTKKFTWTEITHLGIVIMRYKAYFLLTTTRGFYIFSNLLQGHAVLIRHLSDKLGDEKVEVEVKNYLENPIERTSLIIFTWIVLIIVVVIILSKLFG